MEDASIAVDQVNLVPHQRKEAINPAEIRIMLLRGVPTVVVAHHHEQRLREVVALEDADNKLTF